MRVLSQDESRVGLLPVRRRRLTLRGVKPVGRVQYTSASYDLYGAVEPTTGESFSLELPALDADCLQVPLTAFAARYAGSVDVLVADNGACHAARRLQVPANVVLLPLPPYSPDLNPIERAWRDLTDRLAGAFFERLHGLKDHVAQLLRSYTPATLRSLTGYPLFVGAVGGPLL